MFMPQILHDFLQGNSTVGHVSCFRNSEVVSSYWTPQIKVFQISIESSTQSGFNNIHSVMGMEFASCSFAHKLSV